MGWGQVADERRLPVVREGEQSGPGRLVAGLVFKSGLFARVRQHQLDSDKQLDTTDLHL